MSFGQTCGSTGTYKLYLSQDNDPTFFADIPAGTTSASFDLGTGKFKYSYLGSEFFLTLFNNLPLNSYIIFQFSIFIIHQGIGIGRSGPSTEYFFLLPAK